MASPGGPVWAQMVAGEAPDTTQKDPDQKRRDSLNAAYWTDLLEQIERDASYLKHLKNRAGGPPTDLIDALEGVQRDLKRIAEYVQIGVV